MSVPLWPTARLGEALTAMTRALGGGAAVEDPPADLGRGDTGAADVARWVGAAAAAAGLESLPVDARISSVRAVASGGTGLLLPASEGRFAAVLGPVRRDGTALVLSPDEATLAVAAEDIDRAVWGEAASAAAARVEGFCDRLGLAAPVRPAVSDVLGRRRGRVRPLPGWSVAPAQASFGARLRHVGAPWLAARSLAAFIVTFALTLGAWWLVGQGALDGRLERGWLLAWALMLVTVVAFNVSGAWAAAKLSVQLGGLTRERLLEGILALPSEEVRTMGVGQLLGAVLETEAMDALARSGGALLGTGVVQLLAGGVVLASGASPWLHLVLLVLWLAVVGALARRYNRAIRRWAEARLALTHDLVESMVGHRTLVAQGTVSGAGGDERLLAYQRAGASLDGTAAWLFTVAPRGWLVVGLLGLTPGFVSGLAAPGDMAISLGGMMLVYWGLRRLGDAGPTLAAAALAWRRTRRFFAAAAGKVQRSRAVVATGTDQAAAGTRGLLVARDVAFHYRGRPEPTLRGCSFAIQRGDRILLQGGSGSGKSTLSGLITGLREPTSGALMLGGFDHHTLGPERWRERAGGVPQFHENHVLSASMVFNMAMGRAWPPTPEDWKEIQTVCKELGFDNLLQRMPAGLQQMVGDSGWQLSHGEASRLFVARSLLQDLDVRVLDESFAALDPETFERVLDCVLRRSPTLVVVAHL